MKRVEDDIGELLCYIMASTEIAVACSNIVEMSEFLNLLLTQTTMYEINLSLEEITKEQYKGIWTQIHVLSLLIDSLKTKLLLLHLLFFALLFSS